MNAKKIKKLKKFQNPKLPFSKIPKSMRFLVVGKTYRTSREDNFFVNSKTRDLVLKNKSHKSFHPVIECQKAIYTGQSVNVKPSTVVTIETGRELLGLRGPIQGDTWSAERVFLVGRNAKRRLMWTVQFSSAADATMAAAKLARERGIQLNR